MDLNFKSIGIKIHSEKDLKLIRLDLLIFKSNVRFKI